MPTKFVVWGASLAPYARDKNLLQALRSLGEVTIISTATPQKPYRLQFVGTLLKSLWQTFTITIPQDTDFVVVLFPDNENMWSARLYRFLHRRRYQIIFDPFISIYDTYVYNKPLKLINHPVPGLTSLLKWWLQWYEKTLFNGADVLLTDTTNHGQYLKKLLGFRENMSVVLLGADEDQFKPSQLDTKAFWQTTPLTVIWYGKVSLMHGVDYIIEALKLLTTTEVHVTLVGDLRQFPAELLQELTQRGVLTYIEEIAPHYVGQAKLKELLEQSHVSLGMFGQTDKSHNVITNKEYEAWATGRALVTTRAQREFLVDGRNCLMVTTTKPRELADALVKLAYDRQFLQTLAYQGRADFEQYASLPAITASLSQILHLK